jgi:iron complex outermembrane recepter protein
MKTLKGRTLGVAAAVSTTLASAGVSAQEQSAPRPVLEEIVVTAQKREESLQEAPISISVLSGDDLAVRGISNLKDLTAGAIPSVRFAPFFGRASAPALSMRGLSSGDVTQISRDPAFGIYIDGVYLGRVQGLGVDMLDIERMEVLRGPQGTLFGRNAVGGALNIVSRRPTGEFGIRQKVGVSNYDGRTVSTNLDLPSFADISIKLDGLWSERDGWVNNPSQGEWDYSEYRKNGFRLSTLWEPNERFDALYSYDNSRDRSASGYPHIVELTENATTGAILTPLPPGWTVDAKDRESRARVGAPLDPSVGEVEGHSINASFSVSDSIEIRSISAWRELDQSQRDQWAGAFRRAIVFPGGVARPAAFGRYSLAEVWQEQFSQELQILGTYDRLKYVAGLFYFEEKAEDSAAAFQTVIYDPTFTEVLPVPFPDTSDLGALAGGRASRNEAESQAAFAQATWTPPVLEDRLDVTVGLRYTDDDKKGNLTAPSDIGYTFKSDRWDPAFSVAYAWTDELNTYLRWGRAYRAGGANSRSETFRPFGDEEVVAWEVGAKSEFWDRRARVNVALYTSEYTDQQFTFTSPSNPSVTETVNVDEDVTINGAEIDLTVLVLPDLTFNANYAYTDRDKPDVYNPFRDEFVATNPGFSPKHAASFAVDYDFRPFSVGLVTAHLDVNTSSGAYTSSLGMDLKTSSYALVNARLTLGELALPNVGGELAVALWGRNLLDKEYRVFDAQIDVPGLLAATDTWYGDPRTYGVELSYRF